MHKHWSILLKANNMSLGKHNLQYFCLFLSDSENQIGGQESDKSPF